MVNHDIMFFLASSQSICTVGSRRAPANCISPSGNAGIVELHYRPTHLLESEPGRYRLRGAVCWLSWHHRSECPVSILDKWCRIYRRQLYEAPLFRWHTGGYPVLWSLPGIWQYIPFRLFLQCSFLLLPARGKAYAVSSTGGDTEGESGGVSCSFYYLHWLEDVEQEENASTCVANSSANEMNFTLLFSYLTWFFIKWW